MIEEITNKIEEVLDDTIKKAFGNSLKELREHCQITQKELAKETKVPFQSISVYERGQTAPTITQAYRIAFYFNLNINDFIEYGLPYNNILYQNEYKSITDKYDALNKL